MKLVEASKIEGITCDIILANEVEMAMKLGEDMIVGITVKGASVRLIKKSLELNATLGKRISTAKFDYLGEEKLVTPSYATMDASAYGGVTFPYSKDEVKIDRKAIDFVSCALRRNSPCCRCIDPKMVDGPLPGWGNR